MGVNDTGEQLAAAKDYIIDLEAKIAEQQAALEEAAMKMPPQGSAMVILNILWWEQEHGRKPTVSEARGYFLKETKASTEAWAEAGYLLRDDDVDA